MKIQAIKPQTNTFQANKKFRIYSDSMELIDLGSRVAFSNNTRWAKEYENPNAKDLYLKAKATKNWKEKVKYLDEMGHYKMLIFGSGISGLIRRIFNKPLTFMET